MNRFTKAITTLRARLKYASIAFTNYTFMGWRTDWTKPWRRSSGIDLSSVGDGSGNSAVQACVLWIANTFAEAPIRVIDNDGEEIERHPMTALLRRPNPFYSGRLLWMATLVDFNISGNAYWLKVRSGVGKPVQLWYTPSTIIRPRWPEDGSAFISHYEYTPAGQPIRIEIEDVVHFRNGLNPQTRCGISPLATVLGEVFTDTEAATFTGTLLKNLGVPGVVISPDASDVDLDEDATEQIKNNFIEKFGGDRRGEPLVLGGPTKVQVLSFTPEQMNLAALRLIPEARICAVLRLPPIVVGLSVGLEHGTYSNYEQAFRAAYRQNIGPTQAIFAEELDVQLLPDFGNTDAQDVEFDTSNIPELQEDRQKVAAYCATLVSASVMSIADARERFGLEVLPQHEVYKVAGAFRFVTLDELAAPAPEPTPPMLITEGEPMPDDTQPLKGGDTLLALAAYGDSHPGSKSRKAAMVADADEAERLFEERLRLVGLEPAKAGTNGRH